MFQKFTALQCTQLLIIFVIGTQLLACGGGGGGSDAIASTASTSTASVSGTASSVAAASDVNTAPVISGKPAGSVTVNAVYSFQPGASDANGDRLTFSIRNKPAWASFSTGSGRLGGTPADRHEGRYSNIVILVTDGINTVSLPAFSIQVNKAVSSSSQVSTSVPTGSFSLGWTAPASRSDGAPLSLADISAYRIYHGTSPGTYPDVIKVNDGTTTSVTVTGVPQGTIYVAMTTTDTGGRESVYSQEIVKVVQ